MKNILFTFVLLCCFISLIFAAEYVTVDRHSSRMSTQQNPLESLSTSRTADNNNDRYTGYINICFDAVAIGSTRGEFTISTSRDGLVETPFEWFNEIARENQITELRQAYRVKNQDWHQNGRYPMNVFKIQASDISRNDDLLVSLRANSNILFAEKEIINMTNYIPNDPMLPDLWFLENVQAFDAWDIQPGGIEEIIIGISDSGVKWNHPDLKANMWVNTAELPGITINWETGEITGGDGVDNDGNGFVDDVMGWDFWAYDYGGQSNNPFQTGNGSRHGTHVAGTAAAVGDNNVGIAGLAYNVKIVATKHSPFNVMSTAIHDGYSSLFYLADLGVHIINCSWGGFGGEDISNLAASYAKAQGSLVIAAAGNFDYDSDDAPYYPASAVDVLGVIATNINDQKADFSNFGVDYAISAPGVDILSTYFNSNGDDTYDDSDGTSMASPVVAGVAALVLSQNPTMSVDDLIGFLLYGADPINHLNPKYQGKMGAGRVNAFNSVNLAIKYDHDLVATEISGPSAIMENTQTAHSITVRNMGLLPASDYTVNLVQSSDLGVRNDYWSLDNAERSSALQRVDTIISTTPGVYLAAGESHTFTLNWTPTNTGSIQIYGQVIYTPDQRPQNNQTNLHNVVIIPEGLEEIYVGDPYSSLFDSLFLDFSFLKNMSQTIYLEEELETGIIYQMSVRFSGDGSVTNNNTIRLYMANTNQSTFEDTNSWIPYSQFSLVYEGRPRFNTTDTIDLFITLDTPFEHQSHNLAILAIRDHHIEYDWGNAFQMTPVDKPRTIYTNTNSFVLPHPTPFPDAWDVVEAITNARFYFKPNDYDKFNPPTNLLLSEYIIPIDLSWNTPATGGVGNLQHYRVYRNGEMIQTTTSTQYTDLTAPQDTYLEYFITAVFENPAGESVASNTVFTYLQFFPPTNLISTIENNTVMLSWIEPYPGSIGTLQGYRIYRDGVYLSNTSNTNFIDNDPTLGKKREYYVTAVYQDIYESEASNTVEATIIPIEWRPSNYDQYNAGTEWNPYLISNLDNLRWMSLASQKWWLYENTRIHFLQTADIDASDTINWDDGKGFQPIGNEIIGNFFGVYDGSDFTIQNLYLNQPKSWTANTITYQIAGLFATINNSMIKNVHLENIYIHIPDSDQVIRSKSTGGIAGISYGSTIDNCTVSGIIYNTGSIQNSNGGLAGQSHYSDIINSISSVNINSDGYIGNIGGIVGYSVYNNIENCFSSGDLNGGDISGGITGIDTESSITNCLSIGTISSNSHSGGIVGVTAESYISHSFSTSNVSGNNSTGGIVGYSGFFTVIENSFFTGIVTGINYSGGIVGVLNNSSIKNNYSAGSLNGNFKGGISGHIISSNISESFWDIDTSGITDAFNTSNGNEIIINTYGLQSSALKLSSTYIDNGWDFDDVWEHNPDRNFGYPYLQSLPDVPFSYRPQNLSGIEEQSSVMLQWETPQAGSTGVLESYKVYHRLDSSDDWILRHQTTNASALSWTDTGLTAGVTYHYFVTAVYTEPDGESAPSNEIIITIEIPLPNPAINPVPVHTATNVPLTQVLSWENGTRSAHRMKYEWEGEGGAISELRTPNSEFRILIGYKLYFGTTNPPPLVESNLTTTSYEPIGILALQYGTVYYWQVVPFNEYGDAVGCPIWSFSTVQAAGFSINPLTFDFGNVVINEISEAQTFTITNTGGSPLVIESVMIQGASAFSLSNVSDMPWTIAAGGNRSFNAVFSPV